MTLYDFEKNKLLTEDYNLLIEWDRMIFYN